MNEMIYGTLFFLAFWIGFLVGYLKIFLMDISKKEKLVSSKNEINSHKREDIF